MLVRISTPQYDTITMSWIPLHISSYIVMYLDFDVETTEPKQVYMFTETHKLDKPRAS